MTQLALVIGIMGSNLIVFLLSNAQGWRYMFGLTPILAAVDMNGSSDRDHYREDSGEDDGPGK